MYEQSIQHSRQYGLIQDRLLAPHTCLLLSNIQQIHVLTPTQIHRPSSQGCVLLQCMYVCFMSCIVCLVCIIWLGFWVLSNASCYTRFSMYICLERNKHVNVYIHVLYSPLVLIYIIIISHKMRDRIEMATETTIRVRYHILRATAIRYTCT